MHVPQKIQPIRMQESRCVFNNYSTLATDRLRWIHHKTLISIHISQQQLQYFPARKGLKQQAAQKSYDTLGDQRSEKFTTGKLRVAQAKRKSLSSCFQGLLRRKFEWCFGLSRMQTGTPFSPSCSEVNSRGIAEVIISTKCAATPSFPDGPCKDLLFPHGRNLAQKPFIFSRHCTVLNAITTLCRTLRQSRWGTTAIFC